MDILHLISSMDPTHGGVCRAVRTMIKGLQPLGIQSEVASLDADSIEMVSEDSFVLTKLGPTMGPWQWGPKLIPWLVQNLPRFHTIILHGLWLYHGYALHRAMRQLRRNHAEKALPKILVMPHGMLDPYFQHDPSRKLKAIRNKIYWRLIERSIINEAEGLLFTCDEERNLARKTFPCYRPKKTAIVGLGVEAPPPFTEEMHQQFQLKCPQLGNRSYFLFLSRIHPKKGIDLLIKSYSNLRKQNLQGAPPETIPCLVIAGPGLETSYGISMQELAAETCPTNSVHWPGMLSGNTKWGAFYGCAAFVLPSHQENFGIAVVEALACSKPALISDQVNIWREINNCSAGIVESDDAEGTQLLLKKWYDLNEDSKRKMKDDARTCFENHFQVSVSTQRLVEVLSSPQTLTTKEETYRI